LITFFSSKGTKEERGIAAWQTEDSTPGEPQIQYSEGYEVYNPPFFGRFKSAKILRYLPFMPNPDQDKTRPRALSHDFGRRRSLVGPEALISTR